MLDAVSARRRLDDDILVWPMLAVVAEERPFVVRALLGTPQPRLALAGFLIGMLNRGLNHHRYPFPMRIEPSSGEKSNVAACSASKGCAMGNTTPRAGRIPISWPPVCQEPQCRRESVEPGEWFARTHVEAQILCRRFNRR